VAEGSAPTRGGAATQLWIFAAQPSPDFTRVDTTTSIHRAWYTNFEMDGFPQTDEQPEAKRRRLNPGQQPFYWPSQHENTIPYNHVLLAPRWTPSLCNAFNIHNAQIPYQYSDCSQQLPIQPWGEGLISNASNVDQPFADELDSGALGLSIAQSLPEEKDVLICYGMVSLLSFAHTAFSTLCYSRKSNTVPTPVY
jgi:hypothetical protein